MLNIRTLVSIVSDSKIIVKIRIDQKISMKIKGSPTPSGREKNLTTCNLLLPKLLITNYKLLNTDY